MSGPNTPSKDRGVVASIKSIFTRDNLAHNRSSSKSSDKLLVECLQKLGKDLPLEKRISFVDEFCDFISQHRVDQTYVDHLWIRIKDLLDSQHPKEAKSAGLKVIRALVRHMDRINLNLGQ